MSLIPHNLIEQSTQFPSITLSSRQLCDLELLLNGGFAPLAGFMTEDEYNGVVEDMHLPNGKLFPLPIVLPISPEQADKLKSQPKITLKDQQGLPLAILNNQSIYKPDLIKECEKCYGSADDNHPYVKIVLSNPDVYYLGGELTKIQLPPHYDFTNIRLTPEETKEYFKQQGWQTIVGFQTRNPMHRSHFELSKYALTQTNDPNAKLLLHPVVGVTQECDVNYHTRVRCYQKLMAHYPEDTAILSLLPLSMRMAGPREAVWHAIIRKNYGCTHFVVGRDHAGPSYKKKDGSSFYGPYDAHELLEKHKDEIGINVIVSQMIVYVKDTQTYMRMDQVPEGAEVLNISGTEQRRLLRAGEQIPEWFSWPEIIEELRLEFRDTHQQGLALYFVGLSGSGKSTLANAVASRLHEVEKSRRISLLDGDVVRLNLSKGLGFDRKDRSTNVRRIGYVASEVVKHGGIAIAANIAPYDEDRLVNRELISANGNYIEIYMKTDISVCERRDVKGLYKLARKGVIKQFTGISDPFEEPTQSDLVLESDENKVSLEENVDKVIKFLQDKNLLL